MRPNWFIALPVRPDDVPEDLRATLPAGLHRFLPDDLHVTIAFFGAVGKSSAYNAWAAACSLAAPVFNVRVRRLVALGRKDRPSAYGIELDDAHRTLARFIDDHRNQLRAAAGLEAENRPALPHLTLARPPRRCGPAIHERARRWLTESPVPDAAFTLDRLALYTWATDRRQRLFARVEERVLGEE